MKNQTLASALATALERGNEPAPARCPPSDDSILLVALRNSVTELDQIVWRRTGQAFTAEAIDSTS